MPSAITMNFTQTNMKSSLCLPTSHLQNMEEANGNNVHFTSQRKGESHKIGRLLLKLK